MYFEIDSLLPEWPEYEFLRKSSWNGSLGRYRLRTAKLRGVVSQGLALPLSGQGGAVDIWIYVLGLVWCAVFVFLPLFNAFDAPRLQPPVNEKARLEAGFSESEIETLANQRRPAA